MTAQQVKVKALLERVNFLFEESIKQDVFFDEANEYGVLHEMIEVIRETENETVIIKRPILKVVTNENET